MTMSERGSLRCITTTTTTSTTTAVAATTDVTSMRCVSGTVAGKPLMCVYARRASAVAAAVKQRRRSSPCSAAASRARSRSSTASGRGASAAALLPGPVCTVLEGPILLTAPHGKEVWREGTWAWVSGITGRRLHRRELYTTELILRMFDSTALRGQASLIAWNTRGMKDAREGLDPNYLHSCESRVSEWHQALHAFARKFNSDPSGCVHFDVHGKKDRSGPCIDVGLEALRHFAPMLYDRVRSAVEHRLGAMLQSVTTPAKNGKRFGVCFPGPSERDNGFWQKTEDGELQRPPQAPATLVGQSSMLGVLAVQLEIPKSLRAILSSSPRLISELAMALNRIRTDLCSVTVPYCVTAQCCHREPPSQSSSSSVSSAQADCDDGIAWVTPVPTEHVPGALATLLRDASSLHLLDTEKPI